MILYKIKPLSPPWRNAGTSEAALGCSDLLGPFMGGLQSSLEIISQWRSWTEGLNKITGVCPNPGCASPAARARRAEVMPGGGHRGSPRPVIPFCVCVQRNPTQPHPQTLPWATESNKRNALLAAGSGPCLRKQSREAGNQLVGFVPTAANEEPHFSCQLPPGPLWCRWEAADPAPRLPCLLLLPMGWETCLERQFCKSALSDKKGIHGG